MFKLEIVRNGVKIVRTGDSPQEVLHRTEKWLKNHHGEEVILVLDTNSDGMVVWEEKQGMILGGVSMEKVGVLEYILPASH